VGKFSVLELAAALTWLKEDPNFMCPLGKSMWLSTATTRRRKALVFYVDTCEAKELEGVYMCTDGDQEDALGEGLLLGAPQLKDLGTVLSRKGFKPPELTPSSDETVAWILQVLWGAHKGTFVF